MKSSNKKTFNKLSDEDKKLFLKAYSEGIGLILNKEDEYFSSESDKSIFLKAAKEGEIQYKTCDKPSTVLKYSKRKKNQMAVLDLHGLVVEEAILATYFFLEQQKKKGLKSVLIIHGKGSGILKKAVYDAIEKHHLVLDYQVAPLRLGGQGALLVWINKK